MPASVTHRPARRARRAGPRGFTRNQRGSILVEMALLVPVLIMLLLGTFELGRYVLLHQKLTRVASNAGDLAARAESLSTNDLSQIFSAAEYLAQPFELGGNGLLIISSVGGSGATNPEVNWQQSGGGTGTGSSALGSAGSTAALPDGLELREDQNVIIAEVFYSYVPYFFDKVIDAQEIYHAAVHRPRFGALTEIE